MNKIDFPEYMDRELVLDHFEKAKSFLLLNGEEMVKRMHVEESSAETYLDHFKLYIKPFVEKNGLGIDTLHQYKMHLNEQRCKGSGANYRFVIFRRFLRRLRDERVLWFDITNDVKIPPRERREQKMIPRGDVDVLLGFLDAIKPGTYNYSFRIRLKAITLFLLLHGVRSIEVRHARVEDFDPFKGTISIKRKGQTGLRELKLAQPVIEAFNDYIYEWKIKTGLLFPSTQRPGQVLTRDSFAKIFTGERGLFVKAGVSVNTATPHSFRRFHVTLIYRHFKDLVKTAQYMGITVAALLKYIQKDDENELRDAAMDISEEFYATSLNSRRK